MAERRSGLERWLTPKHVFGAIALMLVLVVLVMPWRGAAEGGALSSYSALPEGARALHEVLDRLGFSVDRRLRPFREALDTAVIYAVLLPEVDPTAGEVHLLLQAVRSGAALLVVPTPGSRLTDSLRLTPVPAIPKRNSSAAARESASTLSDGWVRYVLRRPGRGVDSLRAYRPPPEATVFLSLETERGLEPMIVGLPLGRGRMVIASEPDLFQNAELRKGNPAVQVVRIVEWLAANDRSRPVVFDEYHHGFGTHVDLARVTRRALANTALGHVVLQCAFAGLLLLLALGVRPIPPRPLLRIERRSPLEHVGALARAYAAVGATARATHLLVRGLRRRHGGGSRARDELAYLRAIGQRHPEAREAVDSVIAELNRTGGRGSDERLSAAITNIERAILS